MPRPANKNMRRKILSVAADIFFRDGFYKVSIAELVATLRTSKSTVYKHFTSKEAIVQVLLDEFNAEVDRRLHQIVADQSTDFRNKIARITTYTCQVLSMVQRPFYKDLRIHTPDLWKRYEAARLNRLDKYYRSLFAEGKRQNLIRDDINLDFMLVLYTKLTEVLIDPKSFQNISLSNRRAYKMITDLFLEGILTQGGKSALGA